MTKQTIEVEGLPEGWKAVAYRVPKQDEYFIGSLGLSKCSGSYTNQFIILEKIQPRRIVLEDTGEANFTDDEGEYKKQWFSDGRLCLHRSHNIWREVKETDEPNVKMGVSQGDGYEPTLELSVDECVEAMRKLETFNVSDLSVKICRFLKENS